MWIINAQREESLVEKGCTFFRNMRLCSAHFEDSQFKNLEKKSLTWNAIPTIFLTHKRKQHGGTEESASLLGYCKRRKTDSCMPVDVLPLRDDVRSCNANEQVERSSPNRCSLPDNEASHPRASGVSLAKNPDGRNDALDPTQKVVTAMPGDFPPDEMLSNTTNFLSAKITLSTKETENATLMAINNSMNHDSFQTNNMSASIGTGSLENNSSATITAKPSFTNEHTNKTTPNVTATATAEKLVCVLKSKILQLRKVCKSRNSALRRLKLRCEKFKMLKKVRHKQKKEKKKVAVEKILEMASEYLTNTTLKFFESQLRNANKSEYGIRWTDDEKSFALSLFCKSREVYKFLSEHFTLPSIRTLQKFGGGHLDVRHNQ